MNALRNLIRGHRHFVMESQIRREILRKREVRIMEYLRFQWWNFCYHLRNTNNDNDSDSSNKH
jgi:hypothetical protein